MTTSAGDRWRYWTLFGVQTIGAAIFLANAAPIYREALLDPASYVGRSGLSIWTVSSIILIQVGHWTSHRVRPPLPQYVNALLGHVVQFLSRMTFVLASSVFGFVFITQRVQMPVVRDVVILVCLFSLFCYTQEVQRLGKALMGPDK